MEGQRQIKCAPKSEAFSRPTEGLFYELRGEAIATA